jgi:hypothetical protein
VIAARKMTAFAHAKPVLREIKSRRTVGDDAGTKIRTANVGKKISY